MFEIIKSLIEASRDRLKSPILGTYAISFALFNWRPILFLLFSDAAIEDKIYIINVTYFSWPAILWPVLITLFITFGLPYFMMIVDLFLVNPKKSRREILYNEKIAEFDHKIDVASKEFEIQNKKSGTKTIETLQSKIEILEKEKQNIIETNTIERETSLREINKIKESLIKEIEKNKEITTSKSSVINSDVFEAYNYLNNAGNIDVFYKNFDGFSYIKNFDDNIVQYYKDLGLAFKDRGMDAYTNLAYELYKFIYDLTMPSDIKKKFELIISKLNNHEKETFKQLPIKTGMAFKINNTFRKDLIDELINMELLNKHTSSYSFTENGIIFRNIISLKNK